MSRRRRFDDGIRYPVITTRQRLAAAWAGFQDGRKQLPYGEVTPDRLPPSCAALHAQYTSLLTRIEVTYRADEQGYAAPLQRAASALVTAAPTVDPRGAGVAARAAGTQVRATASSIASGYEAADALLARHQQALADYTCVRSLAGEAIAVYTRHLYRWHPQGTDLSARNWAPPPLPLPQERIGIRDDLELLIAQLDAAR